VGTQYRSAIFFETPEQERTAREVIAALQAQGVWDSPVVTEVAPLDRFYPAEGYHQGYYRGNPLQPYCQAVISPKISKLRSKYAGRLKAAAPAR
jgi:peptide-methionine (S)-S-oxide reductase